MPRIGPARAQRHCPYLGLVPYDVADADGFFGRDADVAACLRRLADDGVLAVVGPSGSGKSSLVRAGVAAALDAGRARGSWSSRRAPTRWTPSPLLPATGPAPVLVVDQCEEAVTLCDDSGEQAPVLRRCWLHTPSAAPWSSRCAPTGWVSCRPTRCSPG